jgi:hypothetical protein
LAPWLVNTSPFAPGVPYNTMEPSTATSLKKAFWAWTALNGALSDPSMLPALVGKKSLPAFDKMDVNRVNSDDCIS